MKYGVKYFSAIRRDREVIKTHLDQYSTSAAKRLFGKIKTKLEIVKDNPYIYREYERRPQFRVMVVDDYLVFYKVNESKKIIEVHRILNGMMDIEQHM